MIKLYSRIAGDLHVLLIVASVLITGCTRSKVTESDPEAVQVQRGRLKFAKGLNSLRVGDSYVFRDVKQYFLVNDRGWHPPGDDSLAERINWCDTSPDTSLEMLRCFSDSSENYRYTYLVRMKGDQPEVVRIDEALGSVWIDAEGHWLLFRKFYYNVVTDESIPVKGMPFADDPVGSAPVTYVLGISPDKRTVIGSYDLAPEQKGGDSLVKLWNIDTESGTREIRFASIKRYPWLRDHQDPAGGVQPPPAASTKFVWKRDANGHDTLVEPELLGTFVRGQPAANAH